MTIGSMATALYSFGMPAARPSPYSLDFPCRISAPTTPRELQPQIVDPRSKHSGIVIVLVLDSLGIQQNLFGPRFEGIEHDNDDDNAND